MKRTVATELFLDAIKDLGVKDGTFGERFVPSYTEVAVRMGNRVVFYKLPSGITTDELKAQIEKLQRDYQLLAVEGQTDIEDFTNDKVTAPAPAEDATVA